LAFGSSKQAMAQATSAARMPGEFEPSAAMWIGFDEGHSGFSLELVQHLATALPIFVLCKDEAACEKAQELFAVAQNIRFFNDPLAMFFMRDAGRFFINPQGRLGMMDLAWNHYGLPGWCAARYPHQAAQRKTCSVFQGTHFGGVDKALARITKAQLQPSALVMEGGGIETNGQGVLLANQSLWRQRNPGLPLRAIEQALLRWPGITKVIWLPAGLAEDPLLRSTIMGRYVGWGTGGHTDEFVRFADANTILLAWPDDTLVATHPVARLTRERMQANFDVLQKARDHNGNPFAIYKVPMPSPIERRVVLSPNADVAWSDQWTADFFHPREKRKQGDTVIQLATASYMNFIIANKLVLVPGYTSHGTPAATQDKALRIFQRVFPGRTIRTINPISLNWVGGGPHCATLNQPVAVR
jgi:agmatine deiminase